MSTVAVVGAGLGGLAVACRLSAHGHRVHVFEQADHVGGKLAHYRRDGRTFDTGPTLLTVPALLRSTFEETGGWPEDLQLRQIRPVHRYRLRDGTWTDSDSLGPQWEAVLDRGRRIWDASYGSFLARPVTLASLPRLAVHQARDLPVIAPWRSLDHLARRLDPPVGDVLRRYATYVGSDPRRAPLALAAIAYAEHAFGGWGVTGGLHRIAGQLHRRALDLGVTVDVGAPVTRVLVEGGRARGVVVEGRTHRADVVVSDVDAHHLTSDLLRRGSRERRLSYSALVLLLATDDPGPGEHTVLFGRDPQAEFRALRVGAMPADPATYVCAPGDGTWYVFVNAPPHRPGRSYEPQRILDLLADRGLAPAIHWWEARTPADIERGTRSRGGALHGTATEGAFAPFRRPRNRSPVPGLYLVGGSAHPGGGIPLVLLSAQIVSGLVGAP